jgi:LysM repeat protein
MKSWRRLLFYLLLNILVSACTVVSVLFLWNRFNTPPPATPVPLAERQPTAVLFPTPSPTVSPTPAPEMRIEAYQVQPGDTLGLIAERYGISIEVLLTLNGLSDPDALGSGQVLMVPVTAVPASPTATPTPTAPAGPPATMTPDPNAPGPQVRISTIVGAGVLADERVVIRQEGQGEVSLLGWRLESSQGDSFVFPQLTLFKDGEVWVYSRAGVNTVVELYWNRSEPAWGVGATARLFDPQGNIRATYQVP